VRRIREHGFLLSLLLLIAAVAAVPLLLGNPSLREELFLVLMLATLASSLNIIMGYTGYVSFGHIVFFGLGGYFAFYLMQTYQWNFAAAALAAALPSCLIALLIGMPILRLRGAYFALATIGINEATRAFVNNFEPFGGAVGMFFNFSVYDAYGGARSAAQLAYVGMLAAALATIVTSYAIKRSKLGPTGRLAGPVIGAALYEGLRGLLITNRTLSSLHLFVAGVLLLVVVLFVTAGIVGTLRQRFPPLRRYVQ